MGVRPLVMVAWVRRHGRQLGGVRVTVLRTGGVLALAFAAAVALAGDVQVLCEPGVRVLLDGRLVGISNTRDDGLFLVGVPAGVRTLTVEKDGYLAQVFRVEVPDHPIEIKVAEFVPVPAQPPHSALGASRDGEIGGSVVITSAPQNCEVELSGQLHSKRVPQLVLSGVAPGDHTISFIKEGYPPIHGQLAVRPGVKTAVRGNFIDGRVEIVHAGSGSLRVLCRPDRCGVRFLGRVAETSRGRWNLSHVPAGEHRLTVSLQGQERTLNVVIVDRQRTVVAVSFLPREEPLTVSFEPE